MIRRYLEKLLQTNANIECIDSQETEFTYRFKSDLAELTINDVTIYDPFIIHYHASTGLVTVATTKNSGAKVSLEDLKSLEVFVLGIDVPA